MTANVGTVDRIIRVVLGLVLLGLTFNLFGPGLASPWNWIAGIVGAVMLLTGVFSTCPAYSILGISTCSR